MLSALVVWFITAVGGWILLAILGKRAKNKRDAEEESRIADKVAKRTGRGGAKESGT